MTVLKPIEIGVAKTVSTDRFREPSAFRAVKLKTPELTLTGRIFVF